MWRGRRLLHQLATVPRCFPTSLQNILVLNSVFIKNTNGVYKINKCFNITMVTLYTKLTKVLREPQHAKGRYPPRSLDVLPTPWVQQKI